MFEKNQTQYFNFTPQQSHFTHQPFTLEPEEKTSNINSLSKLNYPF